MPVSEQPESPFESIESAQEFLSLLEEAVGEAGPTSKHK